MTYTPDSPLTGYRPPDPAWRAVLTAHGAVPDAASIIAIYDLWCEHLHLDANLLLAQACHEATYFTSVRWRTEWNPAGLGITADNTPPNPFTSAHEGIEAHCEHICCYAYTLGECPVDHTAMADRRHTFHEGLPTVAGLEARAHWADPGIGYVDDICAIANEVTGGTQPMSAVPTPADLGYPGNVHYASGSGETMSLADVSWFVCHDTEGGFAGSLSALSGEVSAHLLIDRDGSWAFLVPLTSVAYATGNLAVNRLSINVEHVGFAASGGYTDDQYKCCAAFFRFCVANGMSGVPATYIGRDDADGGPLPDLPGIIGHQDVPDGSGGWGGVDHHSDPGPAYDWSKLIGYINGSTPVPAPQPPQDVFYVDGNTHGNVPMRAPFWNRWHYMDTLGLALPMIGYPVAPERTVNGRRVQECERGWLGTQDAANPWDVVTLLKEEWPA